MKRVTGLGGIFIKTPDSNALKSWYAEHLGITTDEYGATFSWRKENGQKGYTVWSLFNEHTEYFKPSTQPFMINFRVDNLEELLKVLKEEGVQVVGEMEVFEYGKFGWIMDPDGNKIELWESQDVEFGNILSGENPSS